VKSGGGHIRADELRTITVVYTCSNNGMLKACACPGDPEIARMMEVYLSVGMEKSRSYAE
jgi:hypothetical protein